MHACSVASDSVTPRGLWPTRLLCPWDSPGRDTGVGYCALLQGSSCISCISCIAGRIEPASLTAPALQVILYPLSHHGSPPKCTCVYIYIYGYIYIHICCSVAKFCPILQPHGLQHTKLSCPSLSRGVCSDSWLLSW